MTTETYDKGLEIRRAVLGNDYVDKAMAAADDFSFLVVNELSKKDKSSWGWISQNGSEKDVLKYLRDHNLNRTDLNLIAYRLRNEVEGGGGRDFNNRVMKL